MVPTNSPKPSFTTRIISWLKGLMSFQLNKIPAAFWTISSIISLIVNIILISTLVILAQYFFVIKNVVSENVLRGLYENFILMDQAHISTVIAVETNVPVQFTLPVKTNTTVVLTEDVRISGARVTLQSGGLQILDAPTNIILPAGSILPISLDITVPVDTIIPIQLDVEVNIPLKDTELHQPFVGLQEVVGPFYWLLRPDIKNAQDMLICQINPWLCDSFFK